MSGELSVKSLEREGSRQLRFSKQEGDRMRDELRRRQIASD